MSLSRLLVEPDVTVIETNRLGLRVCRIVAAAPAVAIRV
jgi:hypothetical protein